MFCFQFQYVMYVPAPDALPVTSTATMTLDDVDVTLAPVLNTTINTEHLNSIMESRVLQAAVVAAAAPGVAKHAQQRYYYVVAGQYGSGCQCLQACGKSTVSTNTHTGAQTQLQQLVRPITGTNTVLFADGCVFEGSCVNSELCGNGRLLRGHNFQIAAGATATANQCGTHAHVDALYDGGWKQNRRHGKVRLLNVCAQRCEHVVAHSFTNRRANTLQHFMK